jgi:Holliday junction resolvasome RuvABC endonuclease subunit
MKVVGLDLSMTSTGVAIIESGRRMPELCKVRSHSAGEGYPQDAVRFHQLRADLMAVIPKDADLVVMEGPAFGAKGNRIVQMFWLWGKIYDCLFLARKMPVVVVPPSTVKKFSTDKGNADKIAVALAVSRMWPGLNLTSDDEADALALASMGAVHLRMPLPFKVLERHKLALGKIDWPER